MTIDWSFLRSRVARRILLLFVLCALLPVVLMSAVSFRDVTQQLTQQAQKRVRQESKAVGMAIYQRLLVLESELQSLDGAHRAASSGTPSEATPEAAPRAPLFVRAAFLHEDGRVEMLMGDRAGLLQLTSEESGKLHRGKTVITMRTQADAVEQVWLLRMDLSTPSRTIIAEVNGGYLWDVAGSVAMPEDTAICLFGRTTARLFCTPDAPAHLREAWVDLPQHDGTAMFEWQDEEGAAIAGYWAIPFRFQFSAEPWTVVLSRPRSAVLAPLASFTYRFTAIVALTLLCVAFLSLLHIRKTLGPLEALGQGTTRIARRDFSTPVTVRSGDEFETLAASFNTMTAELQRQFTRLETRHEIDRSVLSLLDPSRIVEVVPARARELTPCASSAVLLLDAADATRGWLYARGHHQTTETSVEGVAVTDEDRRMLREHAAHLWLDDPGSTGAFGAWAGQGQRLLVLPLFRSRELLGGLLFGYAEAIRLEADALHSLRQLADQVAVALSNAFDLAERKRVEASLRESHAKLAAAMAELTAAQQQMVQQERLRAFGQMASGVAHDFNNTLSPIVGFSELLLIDPNGFADLNRVKEYLQTINLAAKDAAKVVSRLREFYRPSVHTDRSGMVDLNHLVTQSITLSRPKWNDQALSRGVAIEMRTELADVPPVVGHESELREVLTNLIFNAVDAMAVSGAITLRTRRDGEQVALEVADTGAGMTEEVRRRCLEPFFSTKGEKGTGLGLSMVYGIIHRLGGMIDLDSELGRGTTFVLRLPIQTTETVSTPEAVPSLVGFTFQVLVVDDEPLVGRVTSEYLRVAGHHVHLVGSAAEAIAAFHPERVQVVVTDHGMPHMTGRQLARIVREVSPSTPVILLTGGDDPDDESGSPDVSIMLSKPLTMAALQEALARLVARGELHGGNAEDIGEAA